MENEPASRADSQALAGKVEMVNVEALSQFSKRAARQAMHLSLLAFVSIGLLLAISVWQINALNHQKASIAGETDALKKQKKLLEVEIQEATVKNTHLQTEIDATRAKAEADLLEIRRQNDEMKRDLADKRAQAADVQKQIDERKKQLAGLAEQGKSDWDDVLKQLHALTEDIRDAKVKAQVKQAIGLAETSLDRLKESTQSVVVPTATPNERIQRVELLYNQNDQAAKTRIPEVENYLKGQEIDVNQSKPAKKSPTITEVRYTHFPDDTAGAEKLLQMLKTKFNLKTGRISYTIDPGPPVGFFQVSFAPGDLK